MNLGTLALFAVGGGLALVALRSRATDPAVSGARTAGASSNTVRLQLAVPLEHVAQFRAQGEGGQKAFLHDVEQRLQKSGYGDVLVVVQDPTDNTHLTAIARRTGRGKTFQDPVLALRGIEAVEDPRARGVSMKRVNDPSLDPGLTKEDHDAVRYALELETNPRHLVGFASTLEPCFPVSASLLRAKAKKEMDRNPLAYVDVDRGLSPEISGEIDRAARTVASSLSAHDGEKPSDVLRDEIRHTASLLAEGSPMALHELRESGVPQSVVDLARTLVRELPDGRRVVDAKALRRALPPDGTEGFVSPAAVMLVFAAGKPGMSRVESRKAIQERLALVEDGARQDPRSKLRAEMAILRAEKAIDRRRWTDWYRRNRA